jgi:hypothetical protein
VYKENGLLGYNNPVPTLQENRRFRGTYRLHHQDDKNRRNKKNVSSNYELKHAEKILVVITANIPRLPILVTLIMEAIRFYETSVLTRATRRNIPQDGMFRF